ncbi:MAG: glycine zipper family protein [Rhodocyclaceae bacterium]|nr:glycine zipper family protein [Rhodocyclaceae bacterium]
MHASLKLLWPTLLLAACATAPSAPTVMVLPGTGRSFDDFRADDYACRAYALQQIGGEAGARAANEAALRDAAVGAGIGALAGALIGGRDGASVGAGMGVIVGSMSGAEASERSGYGGQRQYDIAYVQCMYAKGHRVPLNGSYSPAVPAASQTPPPPPPTGNPPPPPPAGSPPPPPPR